MSILQRYVLRQFLQTYGLMLSMLIGIFLIIDAFERMDEFLSKNGTFMDFISYYTLKIPFILFYMAPQSVLIATVVTLVVLARNNEFTAIRACGLSITRITMPILSTALIIALVVVTINEFITPITAQRMNYIMYIKVRGAQDMTKVARDHLWHRSANGAIWDINYYDPVKTLMKNVSIYYLDGNQTVLLQRLDAAEVQWKKDQWEFRNGSIRYFKPNGLDKTEFFDRVTFPVLERPPDFQKIQKRPEELSARDMYATILAHEVEGVDTSREWVDLNQKLSYPFISVVLALIGIPLSIRSSRHGGLLFCIAVSLVLGFAFSFLYALAISLGHSGVLHPVLAAWGPSVLFTALGFYMLLTMDSEKLLPI